MITQGDIISYLDRCRNERVNLQRGMNYRLNPSYSVTLMSIRIGAPYADRIEDAGKTLIYEGHDIAKTPDVPNPKSIDQPMYNRRGSFS